MSSTIQRAGGPGALTAAISNAMVGILHQHTGRGPTRARTTIGEDLIVCVLGATLTKGEENLVRNGKDDVVLNGRRAFQETMQAEAISTVQKLSGRRVIAFMSTNHIDPDLAVEVFILEPLLRDGRAGNGDGTVSGDGHDSHGRPVLGSDGHGPAADGDGSV